MDNSHKNIEVREMISTDFVQFVFPSAPFTQTEVYALWQERASKRVVRLGIFEQDICIGTCLLVVYTGSFGISFLYAPYGPVLKDERKEIVSLLVDTCKRIARAHRAVFVRLELEHPEGIAIEAPLAMRALSAMQPRHEWWLDVSVDTDILLSGMHKNTRYGIRVAEKAGVQVEIVSSGMLQHIDTVMKLLRETAQRDHFSLHPDAYYRALFETLEETKSGFLVIASLHNVPLIANIFLVHGNTATHVFGGSSTTHREVQASYGAHMHTFEYMRENNITYVNFGGIAPNATPTDSWYGFSQFKKRFGGMLVEHPSYVDIIVRPIVYKLFSLYKKYS